MHAFSQAFAQLQQDLRISSGLTIVWKDANPRLWPALDPSFSQHRQRYCRNIKRCATRNQSCCSCDNISSATGHKQLHYWPRTCPFGVIEMVLPFCDGERYLGCVYLGQWRSKQSSPLFTAQHAKLPHYAPKQAEATARLCRRLVSDFLHLHDDHLPQEDPRLHQALDFIDSNLEAGLRAQRVAHYIQLSDSRFLHWFKAASGRTFTQHMQQRLMRRASQLLLRDERAIADIAAELGYQDPGYFATAFKRYHGQSPGRFRHSMKEQSA